MGLKRRLSARFVSFAMLVALASAALPHHHHQDTICFSPKCLMECCDTAMHAHTSCDTPTSLGCHHHHHSEENCQLHLLYVTNDDPHYHFGVGHAPVIAPFVVVLNPLRMTAPALPLLGKSPCSDAPPLLPAPFYACTGLRAPPTVMA